MVSVPSRLVLLGLAAASALRPPAAARGAGSPVVLGRRASASASSRRGLLLRSAWAVAAAVVPLPALAKDKGYLTMIEYQALKAQEKKDEELYGLFESLRTRAAQTAEFVALAEKDDLPGVSKLALAWDSTIRQAVLDKAAKQLTGADKDTGASISKKVLEDLKQLDKLAKAGSKGEVADVSATLKGHVLEFVALEPQKLQDKFGVDDL